MARRELVDYPPADMQRARLEPALSDDLGSWKRWARCRRTVQKLTGTELLHVPYRGRRSTEMTASIFSFWIIPTSSSDRSGGDQGPGTLRRSMIIIETFARSGEPKHRPTSDVSGIPPHASEPSATGGHVCTGP